MQLVVAVEVVVDTVAVVGTAAAVVELAAVGIVVEAVDFVRVVEEHHQFPEPDLDFQHYLQQLYVVQK